ncbi:hypothetical protein vseg_019064 [Gypsophila vaccaria]
MYIKFYAEKFDTSKLIEEFEEITKNASQVQNDLLRKILEENKEAEYLKELMNGSTDVETFKQCVTLVTHKDLEHLIQRIVDGDKSPILTTKPLTHFSWSSGTSQGKPKFVPYNDIQFDTTMQTFRTSFAFRNREFPIGEGKSLNFVYGSKQTVTNEGIRIGSVTTHVFSNPLYVSNMKSIRSQNCSPNEVIFGSNYHQSLYCHLLCGLLHYNEVQLVASTFAHSLVQAFETFERVWRDLCSDIRLGVLNERITDSNIRAALGSILKPDPELADMIEEKCNGLIEWNGLIPELFPNVKYIYSIMTGSMEPYLPQIRRYTDGRLPLVCADYGASEGWIGVNVDPGLAPESAVFTVHPNLMYYEFIPLSESTDEGLERKLLGITEVKLGEKYEVVVTNAAGLYRYRLGDVVKVIGFHNATPKLKFIRRLNLVLNINIDKTTEEDIQLAVEEASKLLVPERINIVDFTTCVDKSKDRGNYVICWELSGDASEDVLQECCHYLERAFCREHGYLISRRCKSIGPLELRILSKGTFRKIVSHYLNMGIAISQFKMARCVGANNKALLEILDTNVDKSYFSTLFG